MPESWITTLSIVDNTNMHHDTEYSGYTEGWQVVVGPSNMDHDTEYSR